MILYYTCLPLFGRIDIQDPLSPLSGDIVLLNSLLIALLIRLGGLSLLLLLLSWKRRFRRRAFNHSPLIELGYTLVPLFILIILRVYSLKRLFVTEEWNNGFDLSVKVLGHQWYWSYEISDSEALEFDRYIRNSKDSGLYLLDTRAHLPLPGDSCTRVVSRSTDVLHSWALPPLGVKMDVIPGRLNTFILSSPRAGLFYGQCSEICGINHSMIPIVLEVVPVKKWLRWAKMRKI